MYGLLGSDNIWLKYNYLNIWNLRVQKTSKYWENRLYSCLNNFLAMHITNQKWSFDIFTVRCVQNIFMEHDLYLIS